PAGVERLALGHPLARAIAPASAYDHTRCLCISREGRMQRFLALLLAAFVAGAVGPLVTGLSQSLGVALVVLSVLLFILSMAFGSRWSARAGPDRAAAAVCVPPPDSPRPASLRLARQQAPPPVLPAPPGRLAVGQAAGD